METRKLGLFGWTASSLGLGCMGMSDFYGGRDDAESIATIRAALDAGVTLLDSGDFYGMGHNELLIREALKSRRRDQVSLSIKFGLSGTGRAISWDLTGDLPLSKRLLAIASSAWERTTSISTSPPLTNRSSRAH